MRRVARSSFNPCASYETRRRRPPRLRLRVSVSTHAPRTRRDRQGPGIHRRGPAFQPTCLVRDATGWSESPDRLGQSFNPRASYETRHDNDLAALPAPMFQPTCLVRDATWQKPDHQGGCAVSTHVPRTRRDEARDIGFEQGRVSTHVPRTRRDLRRSSDPPRS